MTGGCSHSIGRGTGRGRGIGRIPFLGLICLSTMAATAAALSIFFFEWAELKETSIRRVEARRATMARVRICFLKVDMMSR